MRIAWSCLVVVLLTGCVSDYDVAPLDGSGDALDASVATVPAPAAEAETLSVELTPTPTTPDHETWVALEPQVGGGSAVEAWLNPGDGVRKESFEIGGSVSSPVVDFLFVVDDSVSMRAVLGRFQAGFSSLVGSDAFPRDTRMAVMNTLPADYDNLRQPHASSLRTPAMRLSPGFGRLLNTSRIARFRTAVKGPLADRYALDGCKTWFSPDDVNQEGRSCLLAHTQVGLVLSRVEAGLHAFKQLLMRREGRPLFRQGAAVNVVFVSDTHDPGFFPSNRAPALGAAYDDLMARQPDFAELRDRVIADNVVSSFRAHAIAPEVECSESWERLAPAYFEVAEAGDGVTADICTIDDYASVIRKIVATGAVMQEPVVRLGRRAAEVQAVRIDGRQVGFSTGLNMRALMLDGVLPSEAKRVEVTYRAQRAKKRATRR